VPALFPGGVGIAGFSARQPYRLALAGAPAASGGAGLSAAIVAGAQILGGLGAPLIRARFARRTSALLLVALLSSVTLLCLGLLEHFWAAIALAVVWALLFAATVPIRQAYLNALIPSRERATILSFDSLTTSTGGVWAQPVLGRAADAWGYPASYLISSAISLAGLPFVLLSRRAGGDRTSSIRTADGASESPD
jgi:MFS family permease